MPGSINAVRVSYHVVDRLPITNRGIRAPTLGRGSESPSCGSMAGLRARSNLRYPEQLAHSVGEVSDRRIIAANTENRQLTADPLAKR